MRRSIIRLLAVAMTIAVSTSPTSALTVVYVSIAGRQQISVYYLDEVTGKLSHQRDVVTDGEPGALTVDPKLRNVYAAIRSRGKLASFRMDENSGALEPLNVVQAKSDPAHLSVDRTGRFLFSAYYVAAQAAIHRIEPDGRLSEEGKWYNTDDKAHWIATDATNRWVFVPHTGPNAIFQFSFNDETGELTPNSVAGKVQLPANTGPRHLALHPTAPFAYSDNEQGSSVTAFRFDSQKGTLQPFQTVSTLPAGFSGANSCARLKITSDGRFLYAANRGHNSIAAFTVDPNSGELSALGQFATEPIPRGFDVTADGKFLVAAGQASGKVVVYRILSTGGLDQLATYEVGPRPWWVMTVSR